MYCMQIDQAIDKVGENEIILTVFSSWQQNFG